MKTLLLSLTCVTGLVASAGAQVFQPETARNILIGSIAGAIIGENNDKPLEGALIGAAAGGLWSAVTVPAREQRAYAPPAPSAPVHYQSRQVCEPPRRIVVVPPRHCAPAPRVIVVQRPVVVVDPYCPPPRRVVGHHHYDRSHHHHRGGSSHSQGRSGYGVHGYGRR